MVMDVGTEMLEMYQNDLPTQDLFREVMLSLIGYFLTLPGGCAEEEAVMNMYTSIMSAVPM